MPTSDSAKAQKRLRKLEEAHTRLAEVAKRINAQAAAIADLTAHAGRIVGDGAAPTHRARRAATTARKPATRKPATRKRATRRAAPNAGA